MFTTVVVPIDLTPESLRALKPAAVIAAATGSDLVAASVVVNELEQKKAVNVLSERILGLGVSVDTLHVTINPFKVTDGLTSPLRSPADCLIVAASHGHSRLSGIVESISEKILHAWPEVPVLLVGPKFDLESFTLDGPILACVDPSHASEAVVAPVARLADQLGLVPWVVTVMEPVRASAGRVSGEALLESSHVHVVANRLRNLGTHEVNWEVLHGKHPARTIAEHAKGLNSSLVAVASRNRGGLSRLALGSVALETVARASCPVLVVHAEDVD